MMTIRSRARVLGPFVLAWAALVACRVIARLISVGSGSRGPLGLTVLTATVNVYWLVAGPLLALLRRRAVTRLPRRLALPLIAVAAIAVILAEPVWYRVALTAFHGHPMAWGEAVLYRGDINLLVVALVLTAGWLSDGFTRALAGQRQRGELESILVDAELRALTLQLQPHFLFNTLQLAAEAAYDDITAARRVVRDLQILLRRTFEFEERDLVRVSEEIDFLQAYLAIQRRRFGARLTVEVHVDSAASDLLLPPLLLQPLVENSIQHGIGPVARDGRIIVRVERRAQGLHVEVRDNGIGFASTNRLTTASGLGLGVTRRRLDALFPGRQTVRVGEAAGGGAIVTVLIPIIASVNDRPGLAVAAASMRGEPELGHRWWSGRAAAALCLGALIILLDVIGAAYLLERAVPPGAIAMWIPVQLVAFALGILLWRVRDVRRWVQRRDTETRALRAEISATRARVGALRSGKDLMLSAMTDLNAATHPQEFDRLVLESSELIRSLLSRADRGQASILT